MSDQQSGQVVRWAKSVGRYYAEAWAKILPTMFLFGLNVGALAIVLYLFGFEAAVIWGIGMVLAMIQINLFGGNNAA